MHPTEFARFLTAFLREYLPSQRHMSANTIKSYRDTFALMLRFCRDARGITPERLDLDHLDASLIVDFLADLQSKRHWKAATRNCRLAALHSFFRYLQTECPERLLQCQRLLAVPQQRQESPEVGYLRVEDLASILDQPDLTTPQGRRHAVLLSVLYDTGARVQELIDLSVRDVRLDVPAQVRLTGKGKKIRNVPLMAGTVRLLAEYLREQHLGIPEQGNMPLFRNRQGNHLSRSGVRYILLKYVLKARKSTRPTLRERISPHIFRHTKAMHLLQAGNPLVVIRSILGHADVQTTEIYARADMEMKRKALQTIADASPAPVLPPWRDNTNLLETLRNL